MGAVLCLRNFIDGATWRAGLGRKPAAPVGGRREGIWLPASPVGWSFMISFALVFVLTSPGLGGALVPVLDLPFGPAHGALLADLSGDGRPVLVLAGDEGIGLFVQEGTGPWRRVDALPPLPAPITALAAADVTGDGVSELIVGTGHAGAVHVLRRSGGTWTLLGQTPYMWSPVRAVHAADLSGDGWAEIVALSEEGELAVFGWEGLSLQRVGGLPADTTPVRHIQIGPVGVDGRPALVAAEASGRVGVWSWPLVQPDWQSFVWGLPASLALWPAEGETPAAIVVTTYERLLYQFVGEKGHFQASGLPVADPRLPLTSTVPIQRAGNGRHFAAFSADGLGVWRITAGGLTLVDRGWAEDGLWLVSLPKGGYAIGERDRPPSVWATTTQSFQLIVDGVPKPVQDEPLFRHAQVLVSARDWAAALKLQLHWDAQNQQLTAWQGPTYVVATVGEWEIISATGRRPVSIAPENVGGRIFMPPELPVWFGYEFDWDPRHRILSVRSRSGQGILRSVPNFPS